MTYQYTGTVQAQYKSTKTNHQRLTKSVTEYFAGMDQISPKTQDTSQIGTYSPQTTQIS